jgi:hypothetical protein
MEALGDRLYESVLHHLSEYIKEKEAVSYLKTAFFDKQLLFSTLINLKAFFWELLRRIGY